MTTTQEALAVTVPGFETTGTDEGRVIFDNGYLVTVIRTPSIQNRPGRPENYTDEQVQEDYDRWGLVEGTFEAILWQPSYDFTDLLLNNGWGRAVAEGVTNSMGMQTNMTNEEVNAFLTQVSELPAVNA